jgi:hypothetical protein
MMLMWMSASTAGCAANPTKQPVDFLDYFLQTDDAGDQWTLGGFDVRESADPDGGGARTLVLNKQSDPNCYEVYKVTDHQVQLRYEVVRYPDNQNEQTWIRRYREQEGEGKIPGALWCERFVTPGAKGVLSRFSQDRFLFDHKKGEYVFDPEGSKEEMATYLSCTWAHETWGANNRSGFKLGPLLRLTSEWQHEGMVVETYDYAKGKGLVNWRWLERISTLKPMEGDGSGNVFHCEEGLAFIQKNNGKPLAWKWNASTKRKGRSLDVVPFKSYWKPELRDQWYVVYRDLSKEGKLVKKMERLEIDFHLPEWKAKPGATIADLPVINAK